MEIETSRQSAGFDADTASRNIIASVSLKEKIFEMHGRGILKLGLSVFFTKKLIPVKAGGNKKYNIPPTTFLDGPRGISFYKGATAFPVTMARGASWERDLEKRIGEAMGKEIRALNANYSGAVCMNVLRHPRWGRAQETYGEDPYHIGEMAVSLVGGIQQHNVQACAKHFAANSMENNRFGGSMNMDERTLHEVYLPHFKKVVKNGVASIMSAYNKLNGEYCGHSKKLLTDILRNDWGFKGYVTSDWEAGLYDTQKGIEAGMNIEMPAGRFYSFKKIKKLIAEDKITEKQIDNLIFPVIRTKLLFASNEDKQVYPKDLVGCKAHAELSQEAAEKSAVLLKNENNLLPLNKNKLKRIAIIGSLADVKQTGDRGSSNVFCDYIISPLEGVKNYLQDEVEILTAAANDINEVRNICGKADAVIVIAGTTYKDEGEYIGDWKMRDKDDPDKKNIAIYSGILALGGDRKYLHLHKEDIDTIHAAAAVNKNIVVSLVAGSAITVEEWYEEVPAIIETFYNGMEGGNALARILFGEVNPSGKLPFTLPKSENDLPPFNSFDADVDYGYYHGYTLFDKNKIEPRYPFGFGLSYTSFQLSDLSINSKIIIADCFPPYQGGAGGCDELKISVKIKNTGNKPGAEVVQLYIGFSNSQIDRPVKLLRGFEKVYLEAGEEKIISFKVDPNELVYYDPATKTWLIEKMQYEVFVGNSSLDNNMLKENFEIN
ncbi:MAG: glycosyl hydrolase [Bacteroidota bacterium]|nr:glycosyl hydrolase [Bacteroidota bacterium]